MLSVDDDDVAGMLPELAATAAATTAAGDMPKLLLTSLLSAMRRNGDTPTPLAVRGEPVDDLSESRLVRPLLALVRNLSSDNAAKRFDEGEWRGELEFVDVVEGDGVVVVVAFIAAVVIGVEVPMSGPAKPSGRCAAKLRRMVEAAMLPIGVPSASALWVGDDEADGGDKPTCPGSDLVALSPLPPTLRALS